MSQEHAQIRQPRREKLTEAHVAALPPSETVIQQFRAEFVDSYPNPVAANQSLQSVIGNRKVAALVFLQTRFRDMPPGLLGDLNPEDLFLPEMKERVKLLVRAERAAQVEGPLGSEGYQQGFRSLSRDVQSITVADPEQAKFPPPRAGTDDIPEYQKLIRLMGLVGVEQLATTGSSDVLALYLANANVLVEHGQGFDAGKLGLEETLDQASKIFAFARAFLAYQSNAGAYRKTGNILRSEPSIIQAAEGLWSHRGVVSVPVFLAEELSLETSLPAGIR